MEKEPPKVRVLGDKPLGNKEAPYKGGEGEKGEQGTGRLLEELKKAIMRKTGVTLPSNNQWGAAQEITQKMICSVLCPADTGLKKPEGGLIVFPYSKGELSEIKKLLKKGNIKLEENLSTKRGDLKLHLLAALTLAFHIGINPQEVIDALTKHIRENMQEGERLPYSKFDVYELATYFVEEYIVREIARRKGLKPPESFEPTDERKSFMKALARGLDENEKKQLAQYVATTSSIARISPFSSPLSFDVSREEGLRRQNIALAIAPQAPTIEQIKSLLGRKGTIKEMFLVAMANPGLREAMPLGALLATNYRVIFPSSATDIRRISIREALVEQIEKSYRRQSLGNGVNGLLPFEEIAGLIVVDNLEELPQESLKSRLTEIAPQVLGARNTEEFLEKLEEFFPDIGLFFGRLLVGDIKTLRRTILPSNFDRVPDQNFWDKAFKEGRNSVCKLFPDLTWVFISLLYQIIGKVHLQRWEEVVKAFIVSKGQRRAGPPLTIVLISDDKILIFEREKCPWFALVKGLDGQWYPTSYEDKNSGELEFNIRHIPYNELYQKIAGCNFRYQIGEDFLRDRVRGNVNNLAKNVCERIILQVNLKKLDQARVCLGYAAAGVCGEEEFSQEEYLIEAMNPLEIGIYDIIIFVLMRYLSRGGKLLETDLSVEIPLTGQLFSIRHPALEFQHLSFEEIQRRLAEIGVDVRIPEITIRTREGYEPRAKALVYKILKELKESGFDAVLGKTMAEEFNRQVATIYVERALLKLGPLLIPAFLSESCSEEKQLDVSLLLTNKLKEIQQKLYTKALNLGFKIQSNGDDLLTPELPSPLTWDRENELIDFLKRNMPPDEFQKFCTQIGITNLYFKLREIIETFLDFASSWQRSKFDRSNDFPITCRGQSSKSGLKSHSAGSLSMTGGGVGEYAISTQAQERFEAAKKMWENFLNKIASIVTGVSPSPDQNIPPVIADIVNLGKRLLAEIGRMSQGEVTEWAERIINGEMAAVGEDIEVETTVLRKAVERLMRTPRLVLVYRTEKGRFGWEVSTDENERDF